MVKLTHKDTVLTVPMPVSSVVEESHARKGHDDSVVVTGLYDLIISQGPAGLYDILDPALCGPVNAIAEGEKGIGRERHIFQLS